MAKRDIEILAKFLATSPNYKESGDTGISVILYNIFSHYISKVQT